MRSFGLLVSALLCELGSLLFLLRLSAGGRATAAFVLFHLAGCFLLMLAARTALPSAPEQKRSPAAAVFAFALFIPLFGALGVSLLLLQLRFSKKKRGRPEFFSIPQLPFASVDAVRSLKMGEGGAWSRLKEKSISRQMKLEALMAAGGGGGHNASRLLQMATGDVDDEIRLVAFNFFEKKERTINVSINQFLEDLQEAEHHRDKGTVCEKLAYAYWEFVYNELAKAELQDFYLDQALDYARQAIRWSGENHRLSILMGRIHLHRGDVTEAKHDLDRAMALGASPDKIVPFKAEALYRQRDFSGLKKLLGEFSYLRHKPGIGAVVSFWSDE